MMLLGSEVEPGNIKRFKTHLKDHDIIEVTAKTFDAWNEYFVGKFGVHIKLLKRPDDADTEAKNEPVKVEVKNEPVKVEAKNIVKATIKK